MGDAGSEACSPREPIGAEQAGPFLSARECPVLWLFVLADVRPCQASSSFFYPSFHHPHTLEDLPDSVRSLFLHRVIFRQPICRRRS